MRVVVTGWGAPSVQEGTESAPGPGARNRLPAPPQASVLRQEQPWGHLWLSRASWSSHSPWPCGPEDGSEGIRVHDRTTGQGRLLGHKLCPVLRSGFSQERPRLTGPPPLQSRQPGWVHILAVSVSRDLRLQCVHPVPSAGSFWGAFCCVWCFSPFEANG